MYKYQGVVLTTLLVLQLNQTLVPAGTVYTPYKGLKALIQRLELSAIQVGNGTLIGCAVGILDGVGVGILVGFLVGFLVGVLEGLDEGLSVFLADGRAVGLLDGLAVGDPTASRTNLFSVDTAEKSQ